MRTTNQQNAGNEQALNESELRDRIYEQLKRHGQVDATKIGIVVRKALVLLWGSVATERERATAGDIAASIAGRLNVINHIHVFQTYT